MIRETERPQDFLLQLPATPELRQLYRAAALALQEADPDPATPRAPSSVVPEAAAQAAAQADTPEPVEHLARVLSQELQQDVRVLGLPSLAVVFDDDKAPPAPAEPGQLVFRLGAQRDAYRELVATRRTDVGAAVAIAPFDMWCPGESTPPFFHTRARAAALIRAGALTQQTPPLLAENVNVIVFDEGISARRLTSLVPGTGLAGGWRVRQPGVPVRRPGRAPADSHGTMVAANILSLAPRARIFDLPVLPDRIDNTPAFLDLALAAMLTVRDDIAGFAAGGRFPGPWVFCHAWGIYDRRTEPLRGDYTERPSHPFNLLIAALDKLHDQVFGAGNCGQFCPNSRCGPTDRGPGESILGANSSPHVLSVGAVRADGLWLGYSSQGPGKLAAEKPDLCAPSHFVEADDAAFVSTGTSAACGIAAGAVAALRGSATLANATPAELRQHLRDRAARLPGAGWNRRLGWGILDLGAALAAEWPPPAPAAAVTTEPAAPARSGGWRHCLSRLFRRR